MQKSATLLVVAAGVGSRLGAGVRKAWVEVAGRPLWWHASQPFLQVSRVRERILIVHREDLPRLDTVPGRRLLESSGIDCVLEGGEKRQDSVRLGALRATTSSEWLLVHDAARPHVRTERIEALLDALETHEAACLGIPVTSTVKNVSERDLIEGTIDRTHLRFSSTPQGANRTLLLSALDSAALEGYEGTDEMAHLERLGVRPKLVADDPSNFKVTTPEDLERCRSLLDSGEARDARVGHGYDIHRLVPDRPLVLGGVPIPSELGLLGHSDGDALCHAVIEALLGAAGQKDIGEHFPDKDPRYLGADSTNLLRAVAKELAGLGYHVVNVDCSILAERPRLSPYKEAIRRKLAEILGIPPERIGVKARTNEGLDSIGRGEAIAVHCVALVVHRERVDDQGPSSPEGIKL